MGKFYECIPDELVPWINKQELFFVATAPLSGDGHVNVSPKGVRGSLHIVSKTRVWYEDLTGSGIETISHLRENGRITIMFCAFEGAARIMRLFGTGQVYEFGTREYLELIPPDKRLAGSRAAIVIDVHKASTSCGYAVPLYTFKANRRTLIQWSERMEKLDEKFALDKTSCPAEEVPVEEEKEKEEEKGRGGTRVYPKKSMKWWWARENVRSLDGLPALRSAHLVNDVPRPGVAVEGADEPPSDGTVVVLGNRIPRAGLGLLPVYREEWVRVVVAFSLGLVVAAAYVRFVGRAL